MLHNWTLACSLQVVGAKASFPIHEIGSAFWLAASASPADMGILNKSEAETFQQFLKGERLWSWPNGKVQLGQSFPDVTIINRLVREGLLDQDYQPTDAGRCALLSWLQTWGLHHSAHLASDQGGTGGPDINP